MKEINLSKYLNKVGLNKQDLISLTPIERLNLIYRAHILTFSYSNVKLRQAAKQHPLERNLKYEDYKSVFYEPVGGYCFQLAALLKDILIKLNYQVDTSEARVLMEAEVNAKQKLQLPPTHMVLTVTINDKKYFLDPGLGSHAPRLPILIHNQSETIVQPLDEVRLVYLEQEKLYILESLTEHGWFRLIQTDLCPQEQSKIEFNLMQLEQRFPTIDIRDEIFVIGRVLPQGSCFISWFADKKELKYVEHISGEHREEILNDYHHAAKLILDKFNIKITPSEIKKCCTSNINKNGFLFFNHKPKQAWTVEFPLDERTLSMMSNNLS